MRASSARRASISVDSDDMESKKRRATRCMRRRPRENGAKANIKKKQNHTHFFKVKQNQASSVLHIEKVTVTAALKSVFNLAPNWAFCATSLSYSMWQPPTSSIFAQLSCPNRAPAPPATAAFCPPGHHRPQTLAPRRAPPGSLASWPTNRHQHHHVMTLRQRRAPALAVSILVTVDNRRRGYLAQGDPLWRAAPAKRPSQKDGRRPHPPTLKALSSFARAPVAPGHGRSKDCLHEPTLHSHPDTVLPYASDCFLPVPHGSAAPAAAHAPRLWPRSRLHPRTLLF